MRSHLVYALMLLAPAAAAQDVPPAAALPADALLEPEVWELSASVFYSDPPGSEDRLTPIVYADRGALHLELRYNYEDLETAAFFAGWTLEYGDELALALTPMLGAVVGDTDGIAPALELDLGWRRISWYGESEYLFDLDDSDDDFFYSWSTLTYGLTDWLSAGLAFERSKLVDTDWSVQRGLAIEMAREHVGFSLYAYNLGSDDSYAVVALELAP
ncbi:MAG TPA: hypothetical protein VF530_16295 [Planctomycetota bacterium]